MADPVPGEGAGEVARLRQLQRRPARGETCAAHDKDACLADRKTMDVDRDIVMGHVFCCAVVDHGPATSRRLKARHARRVPALLVEVLNGVGRWAPR
jgi:hypothetical protein